MIVDAETDDAVGRLWFAEGGEPGERHVYLYAIEIDEGHRGRGVGLRIRMLGSDLVKLNVFGGNARARRLCDSLGYAEVAVELTKRL